MQVFSLIGLMFMFLDIKASGQLVLQPARQNFLLPEESLQFWFLWKPLRKIFENLKPIQRPFEPLWESEVPIVRVLEPLRFWLPFSLPHSCCLLISTHTCYFSGHLTIKPFLKSVRYFCIPFPSWCYMNACIQMQGALDQWSHSWPLCLKAE